jgi:hypothetical protein
VMGAGNIPAWSMRSSAAEPLGDQPGRHRVRFTVPSTPPLNGSFRLAVSVHDGTTDAPTTARTFNELVRILSGELPGILAVPFHAETVALPQVQAEAAG